MNIVIREKNQNRYSRQEQDYEKLQGVRRIKKINVKKKQVEKGENKEVNKHRT